MISRSLRRWVALAAFGLLGPAACELNPQPDLPGSNAVHDPGVPTPGGPLGGSKNMEGAGNSGGTVPVIVGGSGNSAAGSTPTLPGGGGQSDAAGGDGNANAAGAGGNDAGGESAGGFASVP
jgi:hypothetical protein